MCNASIDHYNDNISSAFDFLLRKRIVQYNPTKLVEPIKIPIIETSVYTIPEIMKLFKVLEGDPIELPTMLAAYYGLRRSEIFGLRKQSFDFDNNYFVINHTAIQIDDKGLKRLLKRMD